jgi:hypothetical protein
MKARRVVSGVVTAGAMLVAGAVSASANIAWCIDDPPVQVETPAGANLTVNTGVSVVNKQARYLNDVVVVAVTEPDGSGGTRITVTVTVPATIGTATVTAAVNKFKVSASTTVAGGDSATLVLDVPAA